MSEQQKQGDELSLEDIMKEVSSWESDGTVSAAPTVPVPTDKQVDAVMKEFGSLRLEPDVAPPLSPAQEQTQLQEKMNIIDQLNRRSAPPGNVVEFKKKKPKTPQETEAHMQQLVEELEEEAAERRQEEEARWREAEALTKLRQDGTPKPSLEPPKVENVIPIFPKRDPETVGEAVSITGERFKIWLRFRMDKLRMPKIHFRKPDVDVTLAQVPELPKPKDTPPRELASKYGKHLGLLRLQAILVVLGAAALFAMAVFHSVDLLPKPGFLGDLQALCQISMIVFGVCVVLSYPVLKQGVLSVIQWHPGMETVTILACAAVAVDGLTMLLQDFRPLMLPFCAPVTLVLAFQMLGTFWKRQALRQNCRIAAQSAEPDLVTIEPDQLGGKPVYRRRPGADSGFGSQIQQEDGAQRTFRFFTPILTVVAFMASVFVTMVGLHQPELVFWSLSATLTAAATLNGCLCFSMPYRKLSNRLAKIGATLAGWFGIQYAQTGISLLVEDADLFPPGAVELKAFRAFDGFGTDKVSSIAASLIRASGSGLQKLFHDCMLEEEGTYLTVTDLEIHNDGISGRTLGEDVLTGNGNFLERMGVTLPEGVRTTTGVYCAIGGVFAGQFVLEYTLSRSANSAMDALTQNKITPVLIALDFNLVPSTLKKLFRFPWEKMSFPHIGHRGKLATAPPPGNGVTLGILCLEGLNPLTTMVAGAQRLGRAVRLCARITCLGALIGVGLAVYFTWTAALTSLTAMSFSIFLLTWFLPVALISGWVNQF